jgi:hypothetical protein
MRADIDRRIFVTRLEQTCREVVSLPGTGEEIEFCRN